MTSRAPSTGVIVPGPGKAGEAVSRVFPWSIGGSYLTFRPISVDPIVNVGVIKQLIEDGLRVNGLRELSDPTTVQVISVTKEEKSDEDD